MDEHRNHTPPSEIHRRIRNLQARLQDADMGGALILQNTDLFYFSGTIQQAHLYVPADAPALLMVRKSYERAVSESAIETILPLNSPRDLPEILAEHGIRPPERLGMEMDVLPANLYQYYGGIFKNSRRADISTAIREIRAVKSDWEIERIREAAEGSDAIAGHVRQILREGITEVALAGKLEAYARELGHQGIVRMRLWGSEMFYGHLMAGPSAAVPSYLASPTGGAGLNPAVAQGPGFRPVGRNEPVLVDYVFARNGYISDHTRIFSLGRLPDHLMAAHEAMLSVQAAVMEAAVPGARASDVYKTAVRRAGELGYADHFMGAGPQRIRFVGHGIGLELDEFPFLAKGREEVLTENMVVAVEPKLIFPGQGVVGIENTHVVRPGGLERLTRFEDAVAIL